MLPLCLFSTSIIGVFARPLWMNNPVCSLLMNCPSIWQKSLSKWGISLLIRFIHCPSHYLNDSEWFMLLWSNMQRRVHISFPKMFAFLVFCFSFWSVFQLMSHVNQLFSLFNSYHSFPWFGDISGLWWKRMEELLDTILAWGLCMDIVREGGFLPLALSNLQRVINKSSSLSCQMLLDLRQ